MACDPAPGRLRPVIDRNRCAAESDCVRVCPYQVFALGNLTRADRATLSLKGRMKALLHRGRQAFTLNVDACRACGLCVEACPEDAIKLVEGRLGGSVNDATSRP